MFAFNKKQQAFLDDPSKLRIMGGSAVSTGKTCVGYYEALRLSREIPNNYGVIFCDNPHLEQYRFQDMMQLQSGDYSLSALPNKIFIHTPEGEKSTIIFLSNQTNERRLFGDYKMLAQFHLLQATNLGFVMFEGIETLTLGDVEDIFKRLRLHPLENNCRMWGTAEDRPDWIDTDQFDIGVTVFNRTQEDAVLWARKIGIESIEKWRDTLPKFYCLQCIDYACVYDAQPHTKTIYNSGNIPEVSPRRSVESKVCTRCGHHTVQVF